MKILRSLELIFFGFRISDCGWTKTHGYFLQMGGFILHEGNEQERVLINDGSNELRLDRFIKEGKFRTITEEYIQDRSKGDGLAKALVIIQTSWFACNVSRERLKALL